MGYMKRALELSREALGLSSPNPPVGAVVVKDGRIVGEGHTLPPGQAHAEVIALNQAGELARSATLYTTLEPCCHFGKTPPCTRAIIQAGIAQVHIATNDPNPLVNGKGVAELEGAGLSIHQDECSEEAEEVTEAYIKFVTTGLPFVVAKFAMSLDGKIAASSGDSKWISSEDARYYARELRQWNDAIIVGIGTILDDDPRLTARDGDGCPRAKQPVRIVVDTSARVPLSAQLFREPGPLLVVTARATKNRTEALRGAGAQVLSLPADDGSVDLSGLLKVLGEREITSLLAEGGGTLLGSFFDLGLVDKVVAFVSPVILGGRGSPSPVAGAGATVMADSIRLKRTKVDVVGEDVMMTGYVR
ncbi:MAG: bifunctional diaminohydroxyphosphoribosylaminopyrimidine deaminase/5-amino-6-(5-phosphoribosylamino)uracil reductase RibD [Dehalococcoidia bacterium]|jgi:diaminohydroxyphosphoribosylaminopyrimidine deaminase/5-amino-6-(5-phosphoribosylamino)uracil reductase|nr:bifunctional diaminohydroxyphosphoribosylaminopyrimidine deaminase/5-amino-6-(5-phosphoribosylamino)uracil reductase RibD [Dehalococcoidia bacterium]